MNMNKQFTHLVPRVLATPQLIILKNNWPKTYINLHPKNWPININIPTINDQINETTPRQTWFGISFKTNPNADKVFIHLGDKLACFKSMRKTGVEITISHGGPLREGPPGLKVVKLLVGYKGAVRVPGLNWFSEMVVKNGGFTMVQTVKYHQTTTNPSFFWTTQNHVSTFQPFGKVGVGTLTSFVKMVHGWEVSVLLFKRKQAVFEPLVVSIAVFFTCSWGPSVLVKSQPNILFCKTKYSWKR